MGLRASCTAASTAQPSVMPSWCAGVSRPWPHRLRAGSGDGRSRPAGNPDAVRPTPTGAASGDLDAHVGEQGQVPQRFVEASLSATSKMLRLDVAAGDHAKCAATPPRALQAPGCRPSRASRSPPGRAARPGGRRPCGRRRAASGALGVEHEVVGDLVVPVRRRAGWAPAWLRLHGVGDVGLDVLPALEVEPAWSPCRGRARTSRWMCAGRLVPAGGVDEPSAGAAPSESGTARAAWC